MKLIFIISQPRSGSTLLQAVLSNNPMVETTSEAWLLLPFLGYRIPSLNEATYNSTLALKGIKNLEKRIGKSAFDNELKGFLTKIYGHLSRTETAYVIDKTPRYYYLLDEIVKLFDHHEVKIILLKRNPLNVIHSSISFFRISRISDLINISDDILIGPLKIQEFSEQYSAENEWIKVVKYEDLVDQPEPFFKDLYAWLDLPFKPDYLNYGSNDKFLGGFGDDKAGERKKIEKPNSDVWKEIMENSYWRSFIKGYCDYLGDDFLKSYGYPELQGLSKKTTIFSRYLRWTHSNYLDVTRKMKFKKLPDYALYKLMNHLSKL